MTISQLQHTLSTATGLPTSLDPVSVGNLAPTLVLTFAGYADDGWGRLLCRLRLDLNARGDQSAAYITKVMASSRAIVMALRDPLSLGLVKVERIQDDDKSTTNEDGQWQESWQIMMRG